MTSTNKTIDLRDTEQLIDTAEQRRLMYLILSRLFFVELSAEQLDEMRLDTLFDYEHFEEFSELLHKSDTETIRRELAADFAALFLGLSAHPIAPYESVYTSEGKLLMQEARDAVVEVYQREGLRLSELEGANLLPEDHISFELEYMATLCQDTAIHFKSNDEAEEIRSLKKQLAFLEDHILRWVPRLCNDVSLRARTSFYRGVSAMTIAYFEEEKEYLKEVLSNY